MVDYSSGGLEEMKEQLWQKAEKKEHQELKHFLKNFLRWSHPRHHLYMKAQIMEAKSDSVCKSNSLHTLVLNMYIHRTNRVSKEGKELSG